MTDIREQTISPWPWEHFSEDHFSGWYSIRDAEGFKLGSCDGGFDENDAALIAKAPELLLALQEAMSWILDELESREDSTDLFEKQLCLLDSLKEAGVIVKEKE